MGLADPRKVASPMNMTSDLLRQYSGAAMQNGRELLEEAALLCSHKHYSRSYFLAVAAIEEVGKALSAFDSAGRNLSDPAVRSKISSNLSDHSHKTTVAFSAWLNDETKVRENLPKILGLVSALRHGRSPSMYTDLADEAGTVHLPSAKVSAVNATDCVRLGNACYAKAAEHLRPGVPRPIRRIDDQLFVLRAKQVTRIVNTEDFWWYYLSRAESGVRDWAEAVVSYHQQYVTPKKVFGMRPKEGGGFEQAVTPPAGSAQ